MKEEDLNKMIGKYYDGLSTIEEEQQLRDFFNGENTPESYQAEKEIFFYYQSRVSVPPQSSGLESGIMNRIDAFEHDNINLKIRRRLRPWVSAAAGLIILTGSYLFFVHEKEPRDTFSDPVLAYAETLKILTEVSSKLNHGTRTLEPVSKLNEMTSKSFKAVNESKLLIDKNFRSLEYLQKGIEISDLSQKKVNN